MGAAGVAIAGLQLKGATGVAAGVAVFMAITRLPFTAGAAVGGIVTIGLGAVTAIAGSSSSEVAAAMLVTVLLGVLALFLKRSRESQDRTELLLARLEDARDEQARAAAVAERGRIASELHDVLAHSLSGAAIQLQGARKLADREHASPVLSDAIDRASELVKSGLAHARQAVGALRGDALPTVAELPTLIESYKTDMNLDVTFRIEGDARTLPGDPSLALYRGAQEALTNVARYAPGACTTVTVRYEPDRTDALGRERHLGRRATRGVGRRPRAGRIARADRASRRHDLGRPDSRGLAGRDRGSRHDDPRPDRR